MIVSYDSERKIRNLRISVIVLFSVIFLQYILIVRLMRFADGQLSLWERQNSFNKTVSGFMSGQVKFDKMVQDKVIINLK